MLILTLIGIVLAAFTGTAVAASVATDPSTGDIFKQIFDAVVHGQWWVAASAGVLGACALERRYAPDSWKTGARGEIIGLAAAFTAAFAGAVGTTLMAPGAHMSSTVALAAVKIGVAAVGGYTILSRVLAALASWSKTPAWAKPIMNLIATIIGSKTAAAEKIANAEAAGNAAVAASPPRGMAASGEIREVE